MSLMNVQERAAKRKGQGVTRADATGNVLTMRGRVYIRIPIATNRRAAFHVQWAKTEAEARPRAAVMAGMARALRATGEPSHVELLPKILARAAEATDPKRLSELELTVSRLVAGKLRIPSPVKLGDTFQAVAELWTSGDLAKRFPHHLKEKRSAADDKQRLEKFVFPVVGSVSIKAFSIDDAERMMANLPLELAPATRRQIAQIVHRVLKLAVFPLRVVNHNPIPVGWLPRVPKGSQKKQATLYPSEADLFVASSAPLALRLFVGFVAREGMRHDEAERLTWANVDTERGLVRLDENKTDDPRSWALRPDTARALARWKELTAPADDRARVFIAKSGEALRVRANAYRDHLRLAGINRAELFEGSATAKPTAIHALRALFVTEALARGMSEAWVTDRTGHRSSNMLRVYQRPARTFREARMPFLGELDALLGWRADTAGTEQAAKQAGRPAFRPLRVRNSGQRKQGLVASAGLEPALLSNADFKSAASTDSATRPTRLGRGLCQHPLPLHM